MTLHRDSFGRIEAELRGELLLPYKLSMAKSNIYLTPVKCGAILHM